MSESQQGLEICDVISAKRCWFSTILHQNRTLTFRRHDQIGRWELFFAIPLGLLGLAWD